MHILPHDFDSLEAAPGALRARRWEPARARARGVLLHVGLLVVAGCVAAIAAWIGARWF